MNTRKWTILVTLCLSGALGLLGCDGSEAPVHRASVAGANSPLGRTLKRGIWCAPSQVDARGQVRVEKFQFSDDKYTQSRQILQEDGSLLLESTGTGSWAVINGQFFMLHNGLTENRQVTTDAERVADKAKCILLDADNSRLQLCPCEL